MMKLSKSTTTDEFVEAARLRHFDDGGPKYRYDLFVYSGRNVKSTIICPIHGEFQQSPDCHLRRGQGCPQCGRERIKKLNPGKNTVDFVKEAVERHGNKYNYSKSNYINNRCKIIIICPIHGEFFQSPINHIRGQGCPKCALALRNTRLRKDEATFLVDVRKLHGMSYSTFLKRAIKVHAGKYKYDEKTYTSAKNKVKIICREHGEFFITATYHLSGYGCPRCCSSKGQLLIDESIQRRYNGQILFNDRSIISPLELDIVIPAFRVAIEYHGLYWHSFNRAETQAEKNRHLYKLTLAENLGFRLFQIYESEYRDKRPIIDSMIYNSLGLSRRIYARKCELSYLNVEQRRAFFDSNHIQGDRGASTTVGLLYNGQIVAAMSFSRHHKYDYEVIRFANLLEHTVVGGLGKLFKFFCRTYKPASVLTYSDRRFFDSSGYQSIGFQHVRCTPPGYKYVYGSRVFSRQTFQKHKLSERLDVYDPGMSESSNMFLNGYRRIWDCGNHKLVWTL